MCTDWYYGIIQTSLVLPSGSDQRRSHIGPSWGTSCFRSMERI